MISSTRKQIRRPIRQLPQEVIERIAAGEIIERPASAVRELVDNALDAGASEVQVELIRGGLELIRVVDNGTGIPADEVRLACQAHTTSKLGSFEELDAIATLGFRGEALASIGAVAKLDVCSASDESGVGHSAAVRFGTAESAPPRAHRPGTTVSVRDLFTFLPARKAALRGAGYETRAILSLLQKYALAYAGIRFRCISDGRLVLHSPGTTLEAAILALFGADVAHAITPLPEIRNAQFTISGAVCGAHIHQSSRNLLVVTVNGRIVHNRTLLDALEAAYRGIMPRGRHPLAVVHVATPLEHVDANIHPAKQLVLIRDENEIAYALRQSVHETMGRTPPPADTYGMKPAASAIRQLRLPSPRKRRGLSTRPVGNLAAVPAEHLGRPRYDQLEALCQFDETLILARDAANNLLLIDQHRAHERVLYEQLLRRAENSTQSGIADDSFLPARQMLLDPLLVELSITQAARLIPRLAELRNLGIDCEQFGNAAFLVRSLPAQVTGDADARDIAEVSLRTAAESDSDWRHRMAAAHACRSAIKRGQTLSSEQQRHLLAELSRAATPAYCPHGSPLILHMDHDQLVRAYRW